MLQQYVHKLERENKKANVILKKIKKLIDKYGEELPPTFKKEVLALLGEGDKE